MKNIAIKGIISAGALALATAAAAEDLTIVSQVDLGKGKTATATQYMAADRVRTSDGENDTIVEFGTGRLIVINNSKKEYYETSLQDISAAFQKMEKDLQGTPMAGMLGKVEPVQVAKGSSPKKVAGYDTEHWVMTMGEGMRFDVWAAPALTVPTRYYEARKAQYAAMGPMGKRFEKMFSEMAAIKGLPLATTISAKMMMVKMEIKSEATEVRKGAIPASAFEVPAGYKKKNPPFKAAA
jgi:hypothetical protein